MIPLTNYDSSEVMVYKVATIYPDIQQGPYWAIFLFLFLIM